MRESCEYGSGAAVMQAILRMLFLLSSNIPVRDLIFVSRWEAVSPLLCSAKKIAPRRSVANRLL
jgi:hypothetical protein